MYRLRKLFAKKGFTLIEMVISLVVISAFFLIMAMSIADSSKLYIIRMDESKVTGILETVADDISGYILKGEEIRLMTIKGDRVKEGDYDVSLLPDGTFIYPGPEAGKATYYTFDAAGNLIDTDVVGPFDVDKFVARGIDLGTKKIYIKQTMVGGKERDYVYGLPYSHEYYIGLKLELIIEQKPPVPGKPSTYEIFLSAYDENGLQRGSTVTKAVVCLNEK